jgi:DNA modification methylase
MARSEFFHPPLPAPAEGLSAASKTGPANAAEIRAVAKAFEPQVILCALASLGANPRNARTHSTKQIRQVAASIDQFGFLVPILIDEARTILAGHARAEAARSLGLDMVPVIQVGHLNREQKRAFVIADNRLAELAGWDEPMLALELEELLEIDLDFDIEVTGFATVDIDRLAGASDAPAPGPELAPAVDRNLRPVSAAGDLWLLGPHKLLCGDALVRGSYERLLEAERAQMVFTDPPYNVPIDGHVCGSGTIRHRDFVMASGEMSEEEFTGFLRQVFELLAAFSTDGAIHYVCMDWRHGFELQAAARAVYGKPKQLCVWNKSNAGLGSFYRSKHELVFVFKNGGAPHINNFGLGEGGRYRTNVWDYPGVNVPKSGGKSDLELHPTVKPLAMVADAIKDCSQRKGLILDPFAGSGTTILAAERTGRIARAIELDPAYIDVALRRWEAVAGAPCRHAETGLGLDELAAARGVPAPPRLAA